MVRRAGLAALLALGLAGVGTAAHAAPDPPITIGCGEGGDTFQVAPRGSIGFVLDDEGNPTGEKLFLVQIDAAFFLDDGGLVGEYHKTYGNRYGHGERIFCTGSDPEEGGTIFYELLVTRK